MNGKRGELATPQAEAWGMNALLRRPTVDAPTFRLGYCSNLPPNGPTLSLNLTRPFRRL